MYCSGKSHTSKRVDRPIFGLPQHGHSLGVAFLCFRFPTTSRKFRSIPIEVAGSCGRVLLFVWFIGLRCCLLGSPFVLLGSRLCVLCGRLGV